MDKDLRRAIILDNYEHPMHKGLIEDDTFIHNHTKSSSCIDNIHLMLKIEDGIVKDAYFDGEACAICTSATSIFLRKIIGKSIKEVESIIINFQNMINELDYDKEILGDLNVYEELYLQPNRKNCALLPSDNIKSIIKGVQ